MAMEASSVALTFVARMRSRSATLRQVRSESDEQIEIQVEDAGEDATCVIEEDGWRVVEHETEAVDVTVISKAPNIVHEDTPAAATMLARPDSSFSEGPTCASMKFVPGPCIAEGHKDATAHMSPERRQWHADVAQSERMLWCLITNRYSEAEEICALGMAQAPPPPSASRSDDHFRDFRGVFAMLRALIYTSTRAAAMERDNLPAALAGLFEAEALLSRVDPQWVVSTLRLLLPHAHILIC